MEIATIIKEEPVEIYDINIEEPCSSGMQETITDYVIKEEFEIPNQDENFSFEMVEVKEEPGDYEPENLSETDTLGVNSEFTDPNVEGYHAAYEEVVTFPDFGNCNDCETYEAELACKLSHDCITDEYTTQCIVCGDISKVRQILRDHVTEVHDSRFGDTVQKRLPLPHPCNLCLKSFETAYQLRVHLFIHDLVKSYSCRTCNRWFPSRKKLNKHMVTHTLDSYISNYAVVKFCFHDHTYQKPLEDNENQEKPIFPIRTYHVPTEDESVRIERNEKRRIRDRRNRKVKMQILQAEQKLKDKPNNENFRLEEETKDGSRNQELKMLSLHADKKEEDNPKVEYIRLEVETKQGSRNQELKMLSLHTDKKEKQMFPIRACRVPTEDERVRIERNQKRRIRDRRNQKLKMQILHADKKEKNNPKVEYIRLEVETKQGSRNQDLNMFSLHADKKPKDKPKVEYIRLEVETKQESRNQELKMLSLHADRKAKDNPKVEYIRLEVETKQGNRNQELKMLSLHAEQKPKDNPKDISIQSVTNKGQNEKDMTDRRLQLLALQKINDNRRERLRIERNERRRLQGRKNQKLRKLYLCKCFDCGLNLETPETMKEHKAHGHSVIPQKVNKADMAEVAENPKGKRSVVISKLIRTPEDSVPPSTLEITTNPEQGGESESSKEIEQSENCKECETFEAALARKLNHDCVVDRISRECFVCEDISQLRKRLKKHIVGIHGCVFGENIKVRVPLPYPCTQCLKSFVTAYQLRVHLFIHNLVKYYKCAKCPRVFPTQKELTRHMNAHASGSVVSAVWFTYYDYNLSKRELISRVREPGFKCSKCESQISTKEEYIAHSKTHFSFVCSVCGMGFSSRTRLRNHSLSLHTKKLGYRCEVCKYTSINVNDTKKHILDEHVECLPPELRP